MKSIIFTIIFVLYAIPSWGTTYWVAATGGTGSSTCSSIDGTSDPTVYARTIAAGLLCMAAGDTLIVKNGTYTERIASNQVKSGTAASPTIIKSENFRGATLLPPNHVDNSLDTVFWLSGKSWVVLDGFVLDGSNIDSPGILLNAASGIVSTDITIQNNEIKHVFGKVGDTASGSCVTTGGGNRITIRNNKIWDCGFANPAHSHAIYLSGSDGLVEHNEVFQSSSHGVHQYSEAGGKNNNIIRYNVIYETNGPAIIIGSGNNNLAHHNIIWDAGDFENIPAIRAGTATGASGTGNRIINNTAYNNLGSACISVGSAQSGAVVKNNLCLVGAINIANTGTGTLGIATNRLSTDTTLVVDALNKRFSPRENSTLINAGENISGFSSGRFVDSLPDQGALEAPIFNSALIADGDNSKIRVTYSLPSQSIRNGVGLVGGAFSQFAVVVAAGGATENALTLVQTVRGDITVGTPVTTGQIVTIAYTRSSTNTFTDNVCIGESTNCKNAEIRTYTAQSVTNNVLGGPVNAVLDVVHFQCLNIYSSVDSVIKRGAQDTDCTGRPGGYFAMAVLVSGTGANPDPTTFKTYVNLNGGTYIPMVNSIGTVPAFGVHPASGFADGQTIAVAILTNPHATFVPGTVVGQEQSAPTVDLVQNSSTTMVITGRIDATAQVSSRFCFQPRLSDGTAITYTVTPCLTVVNIGFIP
jgi:hypothetical protein